MEGARRGSAERGPPAAARPPAALLAPPGRAALQLEPGAAQPEGAAGLARRGAPERRAPSPGPSPRHGALPALPKAESSGQLSAWAEAAPRALPKAASSEFAPAAPRAPALPKARSDEGCARATGPAADGAFRITVVTWNVGTAMPPSDVTSLLHLKAGATKEADMIAIGLQEVNSKLNKRLKDALFTDQWSELFMDVLSPFSFVLVSTVRMQGLFLLLFAKYQHLPFLRDIQTDCTRTGLGGCWGNKGGVSVRLSVFGHMVCFLNCHLPAHLEKAEQRKQDFATILHMQQFEGRAANGILDHDLVFWFGDLNFRIESLDIRFVKYAIDSNILSQLWEKDQLNIAKSTWPVLSGFQEGPLNFPPTFKFDVGTNKYDSSVKKRKPAWTDRILWKIKAPGAGCPPGRGGLSVSQLCYCSHMEYTVSDHKPVAAVFAVQFASKVDSPAVEICVAEEWSRPEQAVVRYRMAAGFHRSSWDWIGLYQVGFRHPKDYVSYVWARSEEDDCSVEKQAWAQVVFAEEALPQGRGDYILGYYSSACSSIVGVTEPFQISLCSSEEGSDEDDSTLVLLASKSRSPSPGKMKQHRSRSPTLAKFQGLILRPASRERGTSRSPSPQGRRGLVAHLPAIPLPKQEPGTCSARAKDVALAAEGRNGGASYVTPWEQCGLWHVAGDTFLARADPRTLGLLPALRLEPLDPAAGLRRESVDQGPPYRKTSPSSPLGDSAGTSPRDEELAPGAGQP